MAIRTNIKNVIDYITHPFGIEIIRHFGKNLELRQIVQAMSEHKINLVLDVGANTGQYALSLIELGFNNKIVSFEPLADAYDELTKNSSAYNNWTVFERCAIGDFNGKTLINISKNSHSSSILPITNTHINAAPSAQYIGQSETAIYTLDSIRDSFMNSNDNVCLKIDTQGFEDKVLNGAAEALENIKLIQLELSLIPLYEGSKTIEWMLPFLGSKNFEPLFFLPGYIDRNTGEIQQLEALFVNKGNG
jgi:FkbM family methyltransferase